MEHLLAAARLVLVTALVVVAAARIARALAGTRRVPQLETFVVTAALITIAVALCGAAGLLAGPALALLALLLFAASWPLRRETPQAPRRIKSRLALLLALPLAVDLPLYLATPPVNWDAMTYHLFLPARWIQEGRLLHVPTVFGDNAAAYAPQNGALLYGWSMALLRSDALANVLQWIAVAALAFAAYRLARTLGAAPSIAALGCVTVLWIQPIRSHAASANVDVWMLAFFAAAAAWLAAYARRARRGPLVFCALSAGLACGTKTLGLPLVLPLVVVAAALAAARRRPADVALLGLGLTAGGGWWYLRNLALYGNPWFPLKTVLFDGAYGGDAVRAGEFHLQPAAALARVFDKWGAAVCGLLIVGVVFLFVEALLRYRAGRVRSAWIAAGPALFAAGWTMWFLFVVPHNGQTRFLLPALVAALPGWIVLLGRIATRNRTAAAALAVVAMLLLGWSGRPAGDWGAHLRVLADSGASALPVAAFLSFAAGCLIAVRVIRMPAARWIAAVLALAACVVAVGAAVVSSDRTRPAAYARTAYRGWAAGFLPFHNPDVAPLRVAYSGANVPFTLTGPSLRHTVLYCNTRGEPGDGFHEHWRRDPREYDYHKPALYRGNDDRYETWLACLREQHVDTVVLFALHAAERKSIDSTEAGFPVEQRWVAEHPEQFETLHRGAAAEIHRLLR